MIQEEHRSKSGPGIEASHIGKSVMPKIHSISKKRQAENERLAQAVAP